MTRPILASGNGLYSDGTRLFNNAVLTDYRIVLLSKCPVVLSLSRMQVNRLTYWGGYVNVGWPNTYPLPDIPGRVTYSVGGNIVYDSGWVIGVNAYSFSATPTSSELTINIEAQTPPPNPNATGLFAVTVSLYEI